MQRVVYKEFDTVELEDGRWLLRSIFEGASDKAHFVWAHKWSDLSRMFQVGSLIEARNARKVMEYFRKGAHQVFNIPETVPEIEKEINRLKGEETEVEELPF